MTLNDVIKSSVTNASSSKVCISGYVPYGPRYCIPLNPPKNWVKVMASKTLTDWVSFFGVSADDSVAKDFYFSWWLHLDEASHSYWTVGLAAGHFTASLVRPGNHFEGQPVSMLNITLTQRLR